MKRIVIFGLILAYSCMPFSTTKAQTINVTSYPSVGNPGPIIGHVSGVIPTKYEIAIVINVFGTYWSKPTAATPYTTIDSSGNFTSTINISGQDTYAEKIHLFMVPTNSVIPIVLGEGSVPTNLYNLAVATSVVDRTPASNRIVWSGHNWTIKDTYDTFWGPGNNYFSASSVYIDDQNRLHLTVHYENNHWSCAEIISDESFGYGCYRFYVESVLTNLPGPVVFGLFTYDDDVEYTHREIDIEFSNGDVVGSDAPLQYVIQPYSGNNHRHRFVPPWGLSNSTHSFTWLPEFVSFNSYTNRQSFVDSYTTGSTIQYNARSLDSIFFDTSWTDISNIVTRAMYPTNIIIKEYSSIGWSNPYRFFRTKMTSFYETGTNASFEHWSTDAGVPPQGNGKVHINLWLFETIPPGNTNESFEVILSGFEWRSTTFTGQSLRPKLEVLKVDDPSNYAPVTLKYTVPSN